MWTKIEKQNPQILYYNTMMVDLEVPIWCLWIQLILILNCSLIFEQNIRKCKKTQLSFMR